MHEPPTIYIIYGGRGLGRSFLGRFLVAARANKFVVVKPATKSYIQRYAQCNENHYHYKRNY